MRKHTPNLANQFNNTNTNYMYKPIQQSQHNYGFNFSSSQLINQLTAPHSLVENKSDKHAETQTQLGGINHPATIIERAEHPATDPATATEQADHSATEQTDTIDFDQ